MATEGSKTYVRRKKHKKAEHAVDEIPHFQGRWDDGQRFGRERKEDNVVEDEAAKNLIKLELDVAMALTEFWRMAYDPSEKGKLDVHLQWSHKRIRSSLLNKHLIGPCKPKEELEDAVSSAKKSRSSCTSGRNSSLSDIEEIESTRTSKESSQFDSRAESPSSPLPSLQLPSGTFLPCGSPVAKSAFQRVQPLVSLQRPCLRPVNSEIEDMQLEGIDGRPQNAFARRKSKLSKSAMSKATLKKQSLGEQSIDSRGRKGAATLEESRVKFEVCPVSDLVVVNKPKSALSEEEKEARRLRRIQANRESARQTIRRKQVVCEELMKKAYSLTFENEGMKQKREALMQKLFSLRGQNYHLKQQLEMEASGNFGLVPTELAVKRSSESASVQPFRVLHLPYAGVPAHSFAWNMAAAQVAAANQAYTLNNEERTLDAMHTDWVLQHQAAAFALPVMSSSKEASVSRIVEQNSSHAFNGVCSPASMGRSSQKETGYTTLTRMESSTSQSEEVPCDPPLPTFVADQGLTDGLPEESACVQANCTLSQPPSRENMECYVNSQSTPGVRCGYESRCGYSFNGYSQTNAFVGRNHFAVVAAAEARKRRKALIRHKFSRPQTLRRAIAADNTKEM